MADIIHLLPDNVANQIAAGEVVQRPASVVKELVENSIDAGATKIQVIIKEAGKTLIQVIDNGMGMSETDARMCFERHATSKIRKANDLFDIQTMGFRGEAMASIAAIASVNLKTKKIDAELGVNIIISGSKLELQEPVSCQNGTNLMIKNLFFNIPARRKFLKSNSTELKHIMEEFQHVALGFPKIEMQLIHNDVEIYNLPSSKIYHRILNVLGKSASQNLVPIQSETSMAKIKGYVGKPENARKTSGEQFFFVNNRYMRHPYFYKAVVSAYENIMQQGLLPSFFIYFDVPPETIDINIHPTKTEIKFENERGLWPIIQATVKEGLGKHNFAPSIDFNLEAAFDIPMFRKGETFSAPEIKINPNFNPFDNQSSNYPKPKSYSSGAAKNIDDWDKLYAGFEKPKDQITPEQQVIPQQQEIKSNIELHSGRFFQIKGKYIMTVVKSGLMLIDQKRAHERILFDEYIYKMGSQSGVGQKLLYPQKVELEAIEAELFKDILPEMNRLGFEIEAFGGNSFVVNSIPAEFPDADVNEWVIQIVDVLKENQKDFKEAIRENLVRSLAKFLSIPYGKILAAEEMAHINDKLFGSQMPNATPDGKTIITILGMDELEKKFK
ncbi:MAG: DNA mismatch repair endonuclease MutL [Salinivirgaceae bacterium]|nr:DNA mismatch repair endonuclease MutL [Salinivirgaceae bacterium]